MDKQANDPRKVRSFLSISWNLSPPRLDGGGGGLGGEVNGEEGRGGVAGTRDGPGRRGSEG